MSERLKVVDGKFNVELEIVPSVIGCTGCYLNESTTLDCSNFSCYPDEREDEQNVVYKFVGKELREFIVCSAIMLKNGVIITGLRHNDCYAILRACNYDGEVPGRERQGFLTSRNRFVNRKEAWDIAKDNDQIVFGLEASDHDNETLQGLECVKIESNLISENLY